MVEVVGLLEAEERAIIDRLLATTKKLDKAWSRIRSIEQDIDKTRVGMAKLVLEGPQRREPVALVTVQKMEPQ